MLEFVKKQVYRTPFIVYTLSLLLVCIIVCVILIHLILNSQVEQLRQETLRAFEGTQNNITLNVQKIDNYFLGLYSDQNRPVLQDFMRFFGNDAEAYVTSRLEDDRLDDPEDNFFEDIKNFVRSNQYMISRISFITSKNSNVITYETNGNSQVRFRVPNQNAEEATDIAQGYVYSKKIFEPRDMTVTLGEVNFLISSDAVFGNIKQNSMGYVAVMSKDGELFFNDNQKMKQQFRHIYGSEKNSGQLSAGLFNKLYYTVYTSEQYGYKMISAVTSREIIWKNRTMFLFVLLGTLFIFVSITLLIAMRMSYDARYLSRITQAIDHARTGKFVKIDAEKRKDEYSIIAKKLNDMSEQLDDYIRKEYILKLKQKEAEMKTLQQQINPHFLYNTLEVIRCCAQVNNDEDVAEAVYNLGHMFREVVKGEDVITVDKELDILTRYLKIMEFKYRGTFVYQIDVEKEVRSMKTVKFWMQPLAENFFIHGFDKASEFNLIIISGRKTGEGVAFEIVNNGAKIDDELLERINRSLSDEGQGVLDPGSIGLQNVYSRLKFFYGDHLKMQLRNNEEAGITISVLIDKEDLACTGY